MLRRVAEYFKKPSVVEQRAEDECKRWRSRLDRAMAVIKEDETLWHDLEDGMAGEFPNVITPGSPASGGGKLRLRNSDQVDVNLLLWASTFYNGYFDATPTFRNARDSSVDQDVSKAREKLAALLWDQGGGAEEGAAAMLSSQSRGPFILWADAENEKLPASYVRASAIPAGEFVDAVLQGEAVEIPYGANYEGIYTDAETRLSDPTIVYGYDETQVAALRSIAAEARTLHAKSLEGVHSVARRCRIKLSATPIGSWFWWDVSVTNRKRIGWVCRKVVFSPEEFDACPTFTDEAKAHVRERFTKASEKGDGHASGSASGDDTNTRYEEKHDEKDRVVAFDIWDKVNWKRIWLVDGYTKFAHKSDEYPYIGEDGRPILRNFFPCAVGVPIANPKESARAMSGIPLLEPGWPLQLEYIKIRSAAIQAPKRSARQALFSASVPDAFVKAFMDGLDGNGQKLPTGYNAQTEGPAVTLFDWKNAPIDYQLSALSIKKEFAERVFIPYLQMSSESPNPNLGQDQLAMSGTTNTQGTVVRCIEGACAEAVSIGLTIFRFAASPAEVTAFLGPGSDYREPMFEDGPMGLADPVTGAPGQPMRVPVMTKDPNTGMPVQATKPSLVDKFRATPLDTLKLTCRFAVNTQADDAVAIKQMDDFIALNQTVLSPLQIPYFDPKSLLEERAKMSDIHGLKDNVIDDDTKAALMQATAAGGAGGGGGPSGHETPGGGRSDSRIKGGGRGPQPVPHRQDRNEGPPGKPQMHGAAVRPMTAQA